LTPANETELTQLLGGDISVESKVARGTTFRFYIKTHTANMLPLQTQSPLLTPIKERDMPNLTLLPRRILVVEDNINQTVLKRQMIKAGLECDVASNGQKALDLIAAAENAATPYDVILMDVEMPVMDGITAVTRLRSLEEASSVPRRLVIALTGNARGGQIDQAMAAGFDRGESACEGDASRVDSSSGLSHESIDRWRTQFSRVPR
jgi:CheY-like chemotaxis protein